MLRRAVLMRLFLIGPVACGPSSPTPIVQGTPQPVPAAAAAAVAPEAGDVPACGAPCQEAERYLGGRAWDYRKSAAIYRAQCKVDGSGPPEACRLYALAGLYTRGVTLDKPIAFQILDRACARGDRASCTWKPVVRDQGKVAAAVLDEAQAACNAGDRSTCKAFYFGISHVVSTRQPCASSWWDTVGRGCQDGDPEACITYRDLLFAVGQSTCATPVRWSADRFEDEVMRNSEAVGRNCDAGHPDSCPAITTTDEEFWRKRCRAGEQFACDRLR